jgi:hypothetical protein
MDEPFGALDELSREELRLELLRIWERDRISVLFVTHSIREAVLLSDRVVVMSVAPGRIVADLPIDLARPRSEALEETAEFSRYVADIRGALGRRPLVRAASCRRLRSRCATCSMACLGATRHRPRRSPRQRPPRGSRAGAALTPGSSSTAPGMWRGPNAGCGEAPGYARA